MKFVTPGDGGSLPGRPQQLVRGRDHVARRGLLPQEALCLRGLWGPHAKGQTVESECSDQIIHKVAWYKNVCCAHNLWQNWSEKKRNWCVVKKFFNNNTIKITEERKCVKYDWSNVEVITLVIFLRHEWNSECKPVSKKHVQKLKRRPYFAIFWHSESMLKFGKAS